MNTLLAELDGLRTQVESVQREKAATLNECQYLQAVASVALQQKDDTEGICAGLATTIQGFRKEVSQNEKSTVATTQHIRGLEAMVGTLTKSGVGLATQLQGASHSSSC